MCGIAGLVGSERSAIERMLDALAHRGPDARATLQLDAIGVSLGHTRLSILDLDARSHQPFVSPCQRYALTFNGEIYNYLELKQSLEREGVTFLTTSDTEVLLHWMIQRGRAGVAELEGMFAFAFVDRAARTIVLARDPIGEKPLYYALPQGAVRFAFASEIQALKTVPGIDTSIDVEGLADYLRFLYTAAPNTLYRGIRELAPGHVLAFGLDAPSDDQERYYDLEARAQGAFDGNYAEAVTAFHDQFEESLRLRLRSDVPVGVYLSGGLDSNSILGTARRVAPTAHFNTFTARYDGSSLSRSVDESALAARAAQAQRVPNYQIPFDDEDDFLGSVERMVALFGQPFGNATAVVADKIAAHAATMSRVCLVGDGGDEILAGYPRYKVLPAHRRLQAMPIALRKLLGSAASFLPESGSMATRMRRVKQFTRGLAQPLPQCFVDWSSYVDDAGLERALGRNTPTRFQSELVDLFARNEHDPVRAAALVDFRSFVPFNLMQAADRTSMAHPLELRCPFLAPKLVELALSLPARYKIAAGRSKPVLADAMRGVIPPFIAEQPKRAFNPPMQAYMRKHLATLERYVLGAGARTHEILAPEFVRAEIALFRAGRRDNSTLLWGLASLECWLRAESNVAKQTARAAPAARGAGDLRRDSKLAI
jgi:asparagine synthase (glutamine-hydrolysing)